MPIAEAPIPVGEQPPVMPEKYMNCKCCSSILGYWARVVPNAVPNANAVPYLFTFAYPPIGVCKDLAAKRINARILDGDVFCPRCGTWQAVVLQPPTYK